MPVPFNGNGAPPSTTPMSVTVLRRRSEPAPTEVFDTYWRFAAERQEIFFARLAGLAPPWTTDPILGQHRFTNAYRVLDRVSQYLLREVVPAGSAERDEVFFRVLLFKLFNRIETWEMLVDACDGAPSWTLFDRDRLDRTLTAARERGERIYSAAYIMPAAARFGAGAKHRTHLALLEWLMTNRYAERIEAAASMDDAFEVLRGVPSFGGFLAYQLLTDLNYTDVCGFDEMDFVQPGPGARDGIAKCFRSLGDYSEQDLIRWVADNQDDHLASRGVAFRDLGGRRLQLIDCQNLFCEVDKYARIAHPEVVGRSGRTRIKQKFVPAGPLPSPTLPAKWRVNLAPAPIAAAR